MRIKRVSCDQFAGVNNLNKEFKEGLNIVVGNNESGKSTLVDFIYNALFTISSKSDKELKNIGFPIRADGSEPSTIEGSVEFEVGGEDYRVAKTWARTSSNKAASCKLTKPDEVINGEEAEEAISELFEYGAGTYRDTVFSSQRDNQGILELLLDDSQSSSGEISSKFSQVLSNAFVETKEIPTKKIIKDIDDQVNRYCMGWDLDNDAPATRGTKGEIVQLHNSITGLREEMRSVEDAADELKTIKEQLDKNKEEIEKTKKLLNEYHINEKLITEKNEKADKAEGIRQSLTKSKRILEEWPKYETNLTKAGDLRKQLSDADTLTKFNTVKKSKEEYEKAKAILEDLKKVEDSDITCLEELNKRIDTEKDKLSGMNISILFKKFNDKEVSLSYTDGEKIPAAESSSVDIDRAFTVTVKDKLEMQISPSDTDPEEVKREVEKARKDYEEKCAELGCETIERAKDLKKQYEKQKNECETAEMKYSRLLETYDVSWEALKEKRDCISSPMEKDAVMVHVKELGITDDRELDQSISNWTALINNYKEEYLSIDDLSNQIEEQKAELDLLRARIAEIEIPDVIKDIDEDELNNLLSECEEEMNEIITERLPQAQSKVVNKKPLATYRSEIEELEQKLEDAKKMGRRWANIKSRFESIRDSASKMDVSTLKDNFIRYMQALTSDSIQVEDISENLEIKIASGKNKLVEKILSQGTRETINLAFRLAMLDELFPDGDGFAIFDDPLVNMDPDRKNKACELLKDFAKKNQVILMTCHPEYVKLLDVSDEEAITMS